MVLLPVKCKSPRGDPHGPLRGGFALAAAGGHGVSCQVPWTSTFHWQQGRRSPKKIQSSKPRSHLNSLFHLFFPDKSKKLIRENWACPGNRRCKYDLCCGPDKYFNKQYWGEICLDTWYKVTLQPFNLAETKVLSCEIHDHTVCHILPEICEITVHIVNSHSPILTALKKTYLKPYNCA